ncbi:bifunctional 4-hydroxy-2-oxoglutarate aldolase/2-dehydro-3-deoxy-phosphogluconate aldolase [Roseomonas sp. USHLN139]|uniref:bifunctional 4-hydroxy-2-oxoglutarate aldolase/2-dehydro-3-deoxy-phosphogluconate aldolase n=1 Tax=Roseomonas sp. USHLN139 TaxID=3081298 RepID=UPI003B028A99
MAPHPLIETFRAARIVPVVRTSTAARAVTAVEWLRDAGITIFEITLTIPDALSVIRDVASDPKLLVGAGTVPNAAAAEECISAGSRFIVSPWVDPTLAAACQASGACLMMGAFTPTEVRAARAAGADVVKIFPASSAGGPGHIKSLRAVFPEIAFCPTGGVDARNAGEYIAAGAAFVGIGGKLVDEKAIAAGDREAVQAAAREALGIMQA